MVTPLKGVDGSGGELSPGGGGAGLGKKAGGPAGGAPAADVAARQDELVLGAGGGDVEQPPFLLERVGVGALERAPGGQQPFLASEEHDELGFRSFCAMNGGHGDAAVLA